MPFMGMMGSGGLTQNVDNVAAKIAQIEQSLKSIDGLMKSISGSSAGAFGAMGGGSGIGTGSALGSAAPLFSSQTNISNAASFSQSFASRFPRTAAGAAIGLGVGSMVMGALPDMSMVLDQRQAMFRASMANGGMGGYGQMNAMMQRAFGGYMTSPTAGANVAAYFGSYGYGSMGGRSSVTARMMNSTSAISLLTGMSNEQSAQVQMGLAAPQVANSLIRMGIASTDKRGNPANFGSVVNQVMARTFRGSKPTLDQVNSGLMPGGWLRRNFESAFGGDQAMVNAASQWAQTMAKNGFRGNGEMTTAQMKAYGVTNSSYNPDAATQGYQNKVSNTVDAYADKMVQGFEKGLELAGSLNEMLVNMKDVLGPLATAKGFGQTFGGTNVGSGLMGAGAGLLGGGLGNLLRGGLGGGGAVGRHQAPSRGLVSRLGGAGGLLKMLGRGAAGVGISTAAAWMNQNWGSDPNDNWLQRLGTGLGRTGMDALAGAAVAGAPGAIAGTIAGLFSMITSGNHYGDKGAEGNWISNTGSGVLSIINGGGNDNQTGGSSGGPSGTQVAGIARGKAGTPYVAGGRSPSGWDCAGFTYWVYKQVGIDLPQVSWEQIKRGTAVNGLGNAKPGDLLFFKLSNGHKRSNICNHVGIYLGNGMMAHAANPGRDTVVERLSSYYTSQLVGIRRIVGGANGKSNNPQNVGSSGANQLGGDATTGGVGKSSAVDAVMSALRGVDISADAYGGVTASATSIAAIVNSSTAGRMGAGAAAGAAGMKDSDTRGAMSGNLNSSPGAATTSGPWDGTKTKNGLINWLLKAGIKGDNLRTAWAIAMRESGGNPKAFNGNRSTGDLSYGLFQINMLGSMGESRRKMFGIKDNKQLLDPMTNIRAMMRLSGNFTNMSPWDIDAGGYAGGRQGGAGYKKWYNQFPSAAHAAGLPGYSQGAWQISQDQIAKIHQGEMILPASIAEAVRTSMRQGFGNKSGGGKHVVIQVILNGASEADARRLANRVKTILDEDEMITAIGGA